MADPRRFSHLPVHRSAASEGAGAAKTNSTYTKLRNDVIGETIFRSAMHRQSRDRDVENVHESRTEDPAPADGTVLREVIVIRAEARQILRYEATFAAERVARKKIVASVKCLIESDRPLIS